MLIWCLGNDLGSARIASAGKIGTALFLVVLTRVSFGLFVSYVHRLYVFFRSALSQVEKNKIRCHRSKALTTNATHLFYKPHCCMCPCCFASGLVSSSPASLFLVYATHRLLFTFTPTLQIPQRPPHPKPPTYPSLSPNSPQSSPPAPPSPSSSTPT